MALTVDVDGGRITSTEGTSAEQVAADIAALDASSKKDAKPAPVPQDRGSDPGPVPGEGGASDATAPPAEAAERSEAPSAPAKPAPAIVQDREPDGTFKRGGKKDPQSRIAHVTWEREEARRQAAAERERREALERELETLRQRNATSSGTIAANPASPPPPVGKPSPDDIGTKYATYDDYVDALTDWKLDQRMAQQLERDQQRTAQTQAQTQQQQFGERWAAWMQAHPAQHAEFQELMTASNGGPQLTGALWDAIIGHEQGPALLHYLASHPEECLQLIADTQDLPRSAASVVRRVLDSKLSAPAAPTGPAPAVTRKPAPAPIQPVGASPVVSDVDTSTLDGLAYVEAENAKHAARMRRRYGA